MEKNAVRKKHGAWQRMFFPIGVCMEMLMPSFGDSNRETGSEPVDLGLPDLSVDEYWV